MALKRLSLFFMALLFSFSLKAQEAYIMVLGIAQDAGYPQLSCKKTCCESMKHNPSKPEYVSSLALVFPEDNTYYLFDCTPDFKKQNLLLRETQKGAELKGIFLTHAHIGHYTGLMFLGRESLSNKNTPVYAMPRMRNFLEENGPWSQLVSLQNIQLEAIENKEVLLNEVQISTIEVPHRDEFSETVAYSIKSKKRSVLFVPDIDKWSKWEQDIKSLVKQYDFLFIDGTFYQENELPNRPMSEVPHPFIEESMNFLKDLDKNEKAKVHFIHLNHTNPLLWDSKAQLDFEKSGFKLAKTGQIVKL